MPIVLLAGTEGSEIPAIGSLLSASGYAVYLVNDKIDIVDAALRRPVDLAILDLAIPQALNICWKVKEASDIPVVILSSEGSYEERFDSLRAGADDFFRLPVERETFLQRLSTLQTRKPDLPGKLIIVWNPLVVDPADYSAVVEALGDLVRSEGGIGVQRVSNQGFAVPVLADSLL